MKSLCPPVQLEGLTASAHARVLYADTDKLGIVYHASYLRYLEMARVELLRSAGVPYRDLEAKGLALPLSDVGMRFSAPGLYDDRMTVLTAVSWVSPVRVHFDYRVLVRAGDRYVHGKPTDTDVCLLTAQTRHACIDRARGRPSRLPAEVLDALRACSWDTCGHLDGSHARS